MPAAVPLRRDFDASSLRRLALNNRQMRAADAGRGADCRNRAGPGEHWESDGVVRWRRIDPVRIIDQRFGVACW